MLFDDNAAILQFLQRRVNRFGVDTAFLCDQRTRRKATVIFIILVPDQTGQHSQIARLEFKRKDIVRQHKIVSVFDNFTSFALNCKLSFNLKNTETVLNGLK